MIEQIRNSLIEKIFKHSSDFQNANPIIENYLLKELNMHGLDYLYMHLRLCGDIPENFRESSTEEKVYSKYSDLLLALAFGKMHCKARVLTERADAADVGVEAFDKSFSFVADAKTFRLSRTAKNQKDFKIEAMNNWRGTSDYAVVVCPQYQLPSKSSQIYRQSSSTGVGILTYNHMIYLVKISQILDPQQMTTVLKNYFVSIKAEAPDKDATSYWRRVNNSFRKEFYFKEIWEEEVKLAPKFFENNLKLAASVYLDREESIRSLSREEAIEQLLLVARLDAKINTINKNRFEELMRC